LDERNKEGNLARKIIVYFLFRRAGDFIEINAIARGHRGAIAFKEHLFRATLSLPLSVCPSRISAMNYISSRWHDGTVGCIKKIVYRQNSGGTATRTGISLFREAMRAAGHVRRVWVLVKRSTCFSFAKRTEDAGTPVTCTIHYFAIPPSVTPEYGKRTTATRSRPVYIFERNKSIEREKNTPLRPMDLILISARVSSKGFGKCAKRTDCVDICQEANIYPIQLPICHT